MRKQITEMYGDDLLFIDGFDNALMGVSMRAGQEIVAVYDRDKCIESLIKDGMDLDEAEDYLAFNVTSAWVGEKTPAFVEMVHREIKLGLS